MEEGKDVNQELQKVEIPLWKTQPGGEVIEKLLTDKVDPRWNEKIKKKTISEEQKSISRL
jgi:hypothetical protein